MARVWGRFHILYQFIYYFAEPNSVSLRNCLDEWFKRKNLEQPVFENTEEVHGSKVTFSVTVSCSNPSEDNAINTLKMTRNMMYCLSHVSLSFRLGKQHGSCRRKVGRWTQEKVKLSDWWRQRIVWDLVQIFFFIRLTVLVWMIIFKDDSNL